MALALNRAKVASHRDLAIAWWGPAEVAKKWDASDWMRARLRYRLAAARGIERERESGGEARRDGD